MEFELQSNNAQNIPDFINHIVNQSEKLFVKLNIKNKYE